MSDPFLKKLKDDVKALLPYPDAVGTVTPEAAREALLEAINSIPDADLMAIQGGQLTQSGIRAKSLPSKSVLENAVKSQIVIAM